MRLVFDLSAQKFVLGPGTTQELQSVEQKRSPNTEIEIQFLRDVTPQELPSGATGIFEVKETGKYDANSIFRAGSWVKTGTGEDTIYTFTLDLMTPAGDLLLGVDEPITVTATNGMDLFNAVAHGLLDTNKVQFSTDGTMPAGLLANQDYYVINSAANTFRVSLTSGGSQVNITTDGTGTLQVRRIDNDDSSIPMMAAMQYVAGGKTIESQDIVFLYRNDIVRDGDSSPPADPADVVLNVRAGKEAITNGTDTGSVSFDTPFAGGANVCVILTVAKPVGGDNIFAVVKDATVDENGFDYDLSAAAPATGYILNYQAVQI